MKNTLFSSFVMSETIYNQISVLPEELQLKFYRAVANFGINNTEPDFEGIELAVWIPMRDFIRSSKHNDAEWHKKQHENGKRGGRPSETQRKLEKPSENPETHNDNDNDNVNQNQNQNKEEAPSFFGGAVHPNGNETAARFKTLSAHWNALGIKPPFSKTLVNLNRDEQEALAKALATYDDKTISGAMLNYQIVCNDPDGYDPGGRKGYGFISFLSKGADWYREEANPLAVYKKRKDPYPSRVGNKPQQSPGWDEEYNKMMRESLEATA